MKRSLFVVLLVLFLLIIATFAAVAISTLRSMERKAAPATEQIPTNDPLASPKETQPVALSDATDDMGLSPTESSSETPLATLTGTLNPLTITPTTKVSITLTATITSTATTAPTSTITPTPDIDICSQIRADFVKATSTIGLWRIQNNNPFSVYLTRIDLRWPKENDAIFNAVLDDVVIWAGEDLISPTLMSSWLGNPIRQEVRGTVPLEFGFGTDAASRGYNLTLYFDNGCIINSSD
ncbi:MAG: hypothetical protein PVG04_10175 [Anaerolineales bacterium]